MVIASQFSGSRDGLSSEAKLACITVPDDARDYWLAGRQVEAGKTAISENNMQCSLSDRELATLDAALAEANTGLARHYPATAYVRQPVHSMYGGAQLFKSGFVRKLGDSALATLDSYGTSHDEFAAALGLNTDAGLSRRIHERVRNKLQREPIEDNRIDFEDGYGNRPDAEEDAHAIAAADELATAMSANALPPFIGLRIKSFSEESKARALRTLDLFLTRLAGTGGRLPDSFLVTLPKVSSPGQVGACADALDLLEGKLGFAPGALRLDLMIETTQAIIDHSGACALPRLVAAARGRCRTVAFGTYDYTAACDITSTHQSHTHSAADFARHVMQVSLAGTGVLLSDGATTHMPIGPHRVPRSGTLTAAQQGENRASVHRAWRIHFDNIQHSLRHGYYQGWDLNPAQLPVRYAAVYAYFLTGLADASARLNAFLGKAAQATLLGSHFDDAATGQGLLNFFLRGLACGALCEDEVLAAGISLDELRTRSFARIVSARAARA